jgi:glyoxylase-like metal-dependent hydrolase (beta-lactamase superfamily II)
MAATQVVPGLWEVKIIFVHAFLLDTADGLVLIDTGIPGSATKIADAIRSIGKQPSDVRHILVTHCHADHSGSLAELKRLTGATAYMHPVDAAMVREGKVGRPFYPSPGLLTAVLVRVMRFLAPTKVEPAAIEHEIQDGDILPGGLRAIHVPGHCAGQLAFLWPEHGGVLIAADVAGNVFGLKLSPVYEDLELGRQSLSKLSALDFEVACFGHGKVIQSGASRRFAEKWPPVREASRQGV